MKHVKTLKSKLSLNKQTLLIIKKPLFWIKVLAIFLVLSGISLVLLLRDPEQSALFADNVLRPIVGNQAVIALEGWVFGAEDLVNRQTKHAPKNSSYQTAVKTIPEVPAPVLVHVPADISPFIDTKNPLKDEGKWSAIANTNLYTTFIRTDAERPYAVVNLVYIPTKILSIGAVAGKKYPGGTLGKPGTGMVPESATESGKLVAAWNGGFQEKDGHYGMFANGTTYVPLIKGLGTFLIFKDGHVELKPYDGKSLSSDVLVARQNGLLLVANNRTQPTTSKGIELWAGTASGGYITWRSGLGITKDGDLVYAVGPSLTPTSLAEALRLGGSVNAMQLDINDFWVRFMLFSWDRKTNSYSYSPLIKGLANGGKQFLTGYEKDFFYAYKK